MSETATINANTAPRVEVKAKVGRDDWIMRGCMGIIGIFLLCAVILPLYTMMSKSFEDSDGAFIGLANYVEYFSTPALFYSVYNSLSISIFATIVVLLSSFVYAYALTRT